MLLAASEVFFEGKLSTRYRVTVGSDYKMSKHGKFDHSLTIKGNVMCTLLFVAIVYTI